MFFSISKAIFLCLFHAPLDVVVQFLLFPSSLRFKSFLSQFSSFVAQIKNICSDPGFLLPMVFAKDFTLSFGHCSFDGGDHWVHVCLIIVMMVRVANFLPIIAWRFPARWDLTAFQGKTSVLCVLACWFFSDEGRRSSWASSSPFHCLLLKTLCSGNLDSQSKMLPH